MNSYIVCIASYKRAKICNDKTLTLLKSLGISKDLVKVFIVEEEKDEYERMLDPALYGELVVGVLGLVAQRQFISEYFEEERHIVSLDDDITALDLSLTEFKTADEFFITAFEKCKQENAFLWGVYPVLNTFYRKKRPEITTSISFAIGAFYGYINRPLDDFLKITLCPSGNKEDVERSIRYYLKDGKIVRFNRIGFKTIYYGKDGGGLGKLKDRLESMQINTITLNNAFPDLTRIKIRKNGMYEIVLREKPPKHSRAKKIPEPLDIEIKQPEYLQEFNDTSNLLEMLSAITVPLVKTRGIDFGSHRSMTLGNIKCRRTGIYGLSAVSKRFSVIYEEVLRIGKLICPFEFESIHLNHNVVCPRHIDGRNTGESIVISLGDYSGGNLFVEYGEDITEYNVKNHPLLFNGGKSYHWNAPLLEGNKYSLVFFNTKSR